MDKELPIGQPILNMLNPVEALNLDALLSLDVKITTYRTIEELLSNAARHAGVNEVDATVWVEDNRLRITFEDHGDGFDLDRVMTARSVSGLLGIRERIAMLDGELDIMTEMGSGVRVMAYLPLANIPPTITFPPANAPTTSKQIAHVLSLCPRTVETHRTNITRKLGLRAKSDLIRFSIKHGLVAAEQ